MYFILHIRINSTWKNDKHRNMSLKLFEVSGPTQFVGTGAENGSRKSEVRKSESRIALVGTFLDSIEFTNFSYGSV